MKVYELHQLHPSACPELIAVRTSFSDWNCYYDNGYIAYAKGSVKIYEHRLVIAAESDLHVHHIDGVKTNNDVSNLQLVTNAEHGHITHPGTMIEKQCANCGATFLVKPSKLDRTRYCSEPCARLGRRVVKRPDRNDLLAAIQQFGNWSALGRHYGVSDNAVRKWAKSYGITPAADGRKKVPLAGLEPTTFTSAK